MLGQGEPHALRRAHVFDVKPCTRTVWLSHLRAVSHIYIHTFTYTYNNKKVNTVLSDLYPTGEYLKMHAHIYIYVSVYIRHHSGITITVHVYLEL